MSQKPAPGRPPTGKRGGTVGPTGATGAGPRVPLFTVGLIAVLVIAIVAVVVVRLTGDDGGEDASVVGEGSEESTEPSPAAGNLDFGAVTVEGDPLPELPDQGDDPAVGMPAPTLVGVNPAEDVVTIDPAEGPMVIAFVAHWCPHCQAEVPRIVDLFGARDELDGVKLVAVATGSDPAAPNFPPGRWLVGEDWPAPVLLDSPEAAAAAAYGLAGYPFLVAVGADGTVLARSSGELGDDGLADFFAAASGD